MDGSLHADVKENGNISCRDKADEFSQKVTSLERILLVTNFVLELPSAAFDQLSSVHKPQYALLSMLMSFTVLTVSIIDLVHKGKKHNVSWMKRGLIPWFYYPYPSFKPFGTFPEIVGLVCAMFQFFFASVAYAFMSWHANNPVNVNVWPIVFAFGLLCCGISRNLPHKRPTPQARRLIRAEEFSLAEIAAATNDFSLKNKIGKGRFCDVFGGTFANGRQVVIKRWETGQAQCSAFESELVFLSRLNHKHLVGLIGYCEDGDDRLLVSEYVQNRALCFHLYDKKYNEKNSDVINSWKMRIKIALDAARGIEYLHSYAVPPVVHRNITSSNIWLDANWTARISDLALMSLIGLESEGDDKLIEAVGTVGYVDPEYYRGRSMTSKSDVYSFGVVLLEILTGKRAMFKTDENGGSTLTSVVEFAVPRILAGELADVLDSRVRPLDLNKTEATEALELVVYTAVHCVNLEGQNRPTMTDVVANLERSLALCNGSSVEDEMDSS